MTDPVATLRVEVAFDPTMHSLVRDFLHVLTRLLPEPKPPAADPEPVKDDALARIERELEIEALSIQVGPALGAFYRHEVALSKVRHREKPAPSSLPPLPVIANRLGALTDDDRAIILAHREAGAQPNGLARKLGVQPTTIHGILYTARLKRDRAAEGKPHKGRGFWTPEKRAELLKRYEDGEARDALATAYGATPDAVRLQLYHGRRERAEQQRPTPAQVENSPGESAASALASWSAERREELRRQVDVSGEKIADIAKSLGLTKGAVKIQLYRARKAYAAKPTPAAPAPAAPEIRLKDFVADLDPNASPRRDLIPTQPTQATLAASAVASTPAQTTVRTLDQHRAVVASIPKPAIVAHSARASLPPIPKPSPTPPRKVRQDLAAEIAAFEATKGVTRIPSGEEFAAIGVPMSFTDEEDAIRWLTNHDHQVKHGPGRGRITVDGKHMPRQEFRQRAAAIAREFGMELIRKQRDQGRAA